MKDSINYAYNINLENLEDYDSYYRFKFSDHYYYFVPYNRSEKELQDIIECSREMKIKGIECHDLILNKNNTLLTKVGEVNYILLKINGALNEQYSISDIMDFNNKLILTEDKIKLYQNNWAKMWSNKVDYFEYQIRELGKHKEGILNSFSYYIGLAENAICYANKTSKSISVSELDKITLSHRRIFYPNIKLNYLNPLSFIFDLEVRDIAEYIKTIFFYGEEAFEELELYLKLRKLSQYGYQMLIARLLYPSYYFDVYEKIIADKEGEEQLIKIVSKVDEYELFLAKVFKLINQYTIIEPINWINKKEL